MQINIVSLFPNWFDSCLEAGLLGKAKTSGLVNFSFHNPRDYALDRHKTVDDRPYGGGPGMVMMLGPLVENLRQIKKPGKILLMSASGRPFTQALAKELATEEDLTLICGRYEGIDARLEKLFDIIPVSVGEAVLNGGESAAMTVIEAISRLLPNFMGKEKSGEEESFSGGVLEYSHYTRPESFENINIPEVLASGNHQKIAQWRREQSLFTTWKHRPSMLQTCPMTKADANFLHTLPRENLGRNLYLALIHYPVILPPQNNERKKQVGASSITNLDIHDIARTACSYGLKGYYIVSPLRDQKRLLNRLITHWKSGAGKQGNPDRAKAFELVQEADNIEQIIVELSERHGQPPLVVGSSAKFEGSLTPNELRGLLTKTPILLLLGTAHGLAPEALKLCQATLRPIRFISDYNHLSVRSAAAIMLDRILGDFN